MTDSITHSDIKEQQSSKTADQQAEIQAVVRSLRTLLEGDEQEQHETFQYLKQVLDEDRPSDRRLFR